VYLNVKLSVVKQSNALLHKGNAQLLCCIKHSLVIHAPRRSSYKLDSTPRQPENIIRKGEKCIRADSHARQLRQPRFTLLAREERRRGFKAVFKLRPLDAAFRNLSATEEINGVT
jgi:hypothetical protein